MWYYALWTTEKRHMDPSQVLKGILDTAVLGALRRKPAYGYHLVRQLRELGFADLADASVYGTLRRLFRAGLIDAEVVESETGPPRKYYELNQEGERELAQSTEVWNAITQTMDLIINRGNET